MYHLIYPCNISNFRAYLQVDVDLQEAIKHSEFLLYTTKRANVDQIVTSLDLLAKVNNKKCDYIYEAKCLTSLIQLNHCYLPDLWVRLGKCYNYLVRYLNESSWISTEIFPTFTKKPHCVVVCCFLRAIVLLRTVEATVSSYALSSNKSIQNHLADEVDSLCMANQILEDERDLIKCEISKDIYSRYNNPELPKGI